MQSRCAVTLRPVERNSSASSSGLLTCASISPIVVVQHRLARTVPSRLWQLVLMPDRHGAGDAVSSAFRRDRALGRLAAESFDVLVVGGGITGAGVALDAAKSGPADRPRRAERLRLGHLLQVVELVHGGIRYLQREYRLVYENLAERQRLLDVRRTASGPFPF